MSLTLTGPGVNCLNSHGHTKQGWCLVTQITCSKMLVSKWQLWLAKRCYHCLCRLQGAASLDQTTWLDLFYLSLKAVITVFLLITLLGDLPWRHVMCDKVFLRYWNEISLVGLQITNKYDRVPIFFHNLMSYLHMWPAAIKLVGGAITTWLLTHQLTLAHML